MDEQQLSELVARGVAAWRGTSVSASAARYQASRRRSFPLKLTLAMGLALLVAGATAFAAAGETPGPLRPLVTSTERERPANVEPAEAPAPKAPEPPSTPAAEHPAPARAATTESPKRSPTPESRPKPTPEHPGATPQP